MVGRVPGVYVSLAEADAQVRGFGHINYRVFKSYAEAEMYYSAFAEGAATKREQDLQANFRPPSILKKSVSLGTSGVGSETASEGRSADKACSRCQGFHFQSECPWDVTVRSSKVPEKYYAVAKGKIPGIYNNWGECFA
jgi:hypothetical protein